MKVNLVPVQIGNGIVVMHTAAEWRALIKGVIDPETARNAMSTTPLEETE